MEKLKTAIVTLRQLKEADDWDADYYFRMKYNEKVISEKAICLITTTQNKDKTYTLKILNPDKLEKKKLLRICRILKEMNLLNNKKKYEFQISGSAFQSLKMNAFPSLLDGIEILSLDH